MTHGPHGTPEELTPSLAPRHAGMLGRIGRGAAVLFLGDDSTGQPIEVVGIEMDDGRLRIIHAMPMRRGYQALHEEARQWPQ